MPTVPLPNHKIPSVNNPALSRRLPGTLQGIRVVQQGID